MSNGDWRTERDSEGFPVCNEDRENDIYTDEYGITRFCTFIDGLGWSWKPVGYDVRPTRQPRVGAGPRPCGEPQAAPGPRRYAPTAMAGTEDTPARFLTLDDVAAELATSRAQVYALVRRGDLVSMKLGGRGQWRVQRADLEAFINTAYDATATFIAEHPFTEDDDTPDEPDEPA